MTVYRLGEMKVIKYFISAPFRKLFLNRHLQKKHMYMKAEEAIGGFSSLSPNVHCNKFANKQEKKNQLAFFNS